ncbi:MAG: hypothetical protein U1E17_04860 [Geminicoccaceae bacterium]
MIDQLATRRLARSFGRPAHGRRFARARTRRAARRADRLGSTTSPAGDGPAQPPLPTGIAAAIYLEELAPRNAITDLIEVNVSNLAAVPSIVFSLLGPLAVLLDRLDLRAPRPLVGGATLPPARSWCCRAIVVQSRAALRRPPPRSARRRSASARRACRP